MNKLFLILLIPLSVLGQSGQKLTLNDAVKKGLDYSKQLKNSKEKYDSFQYKVKEAFNTLVPVVAVSTNYTRISDNIDPFVAKFNGQDFLLNPQILNQVYNRASLQIPFFNGLKNVSGINSLQYLEKAAMYDIDKDADDVRFNIINAYLNVLRIQNNLGSIDSSILNLEIHLRDVRNFEKNGMQLQNDVMRSELSLNNAKLLRSDALNNLNTSLYNLAIMLGLDPLPGLQLDAASAEMNMPLNTLDFYLSEAEKNRADLQAQRFRLEAQKSNIKQNRSGYYPVVTGGANYYYNKPSQRVFPNENSFKTTWDAGVTLSWNLTGLFTTAPLVNDAKINYNQSQNNFEMMNDNVKMEVNAAYNTFLSANEKIGFSESAVVQAQENLRVINNRYKNDLSLNSDVLEAETLLLVAKVSAVNSRIEAQTAYEKLLKATGSKLIQ